MFITPMFQYDLNSNPDPDGAGYSSGTYKTQKNPWVTPQPRRWAESAGDYCPVKTHTATATVADTARSGKWHFDTNQ